MSVPINRRKGKCLQIHGCSPAISGLELPPSLCGASVAGALVEPMFVSRAIFAAATATVPPIPIVRATGGARGVLPLLAVRAWLRPAAGLGFRQRQTREGCCRPEGLLGKSAKSFRLNALQGGRRQPKFLRVMTVRVREAHSGVGGDLPTFSLESSEDGLPGSIGQKSHSARTVWHGLSLKGR